MPTFLNRHHVIEHVALPLSDRFSRSNFWSLSKHMRRLALTPREDLFQLQQEKLQQLFSVAIAQSDFWQTRLRATTSELPILEQLRNLAPVSKSELEAGFPDQVVNRSSNQQDLRFAATRGTTQRMICVHDFAKRESIRAAMVRTLRDSGYRLGMPMVEIPPDICDTVCGEQGESDEGVLAHLQDMVKKRRLRDSAAYRDLRGLVERHWIYNRHTYPPFGAYGSNPPQAFLDKYTDRLQRDRPFVLKGLTTYLYQIAKRVLQRGDVELRIPVIKPLGSGVTPAMRETIETAFGGKFHDDYGSAELGSIACDCEFHAGMHIFSDLFIVEIVDSDGNCVPKGQLGEVVVTDLVNHAMPLIRYKIGDLGRVDDSPCRCGLNSPRLFIEGRIQDALINDEGAWVTSFDIAEKLYGELEVDQFQLNEKTFAVLELVVVPKEGVHLDLAHLEITIRELIGHQKKLRLRTARTIAPESGGKFRWVKTTSKPISR